MYFNYVMIQPIPLTMKNEKRLRTALLVVLSVLGIIALGILQDYFQSLRNEYAFYFSESLLFKVFWIFVVPVAFGGLWIVKKLFAHDHFHLHSLVKLLLFLSLTIPIHAVIFSCAVFAVSAMFFDHTYSFIGNLTYTFTSDFLMYVVVYGSFGVIAFRREAAWKKVLQNKHENSNSNREAINHHSESLTQTLFGAGSQQSQVISPQVVSPHVRHILVGTSKHRVSVPLADILCITSSAPYITIQTKTKEFLHAETLKAVHEILPQEQFVRIHKSTIINLEQVISSTSRLNGDYDILLTNGQEVRLSRNYAKEFKEKFERFVHPQHDTSP